MTTDDAARRVPAPELRETADIWFDRGADPEVAWDATGSRFWLQDGAEPSDRLPLVTYPVPVPDPRRVARVLAEGLAACDFPPTGGGAAAGHVAAALRAAGLPPPDRAP
jgi:hypothetical protein